MLFYDENWDEMRDVLTAWWKHEAPSRPALGVLSPRKEPIPAYPDPEVPADIKTRWLDTDFILSKFEAHVARTHHAGVTFPYITPCLGPGSLNLFLGSQPTFMEDTIWYAPVFDDPATADIQLDKDNEYWKWTVDATKKYLAASEGRFITGIPDMIEGIDVLSELLGTQELLTYLVDCPDEIHRLLNVLDPIYWEAFDPLYEMVKDNRDGNAFIAFQLWGPGKTLKSQCDFAAMISPDMFAEFVCPYLEKQCAAADFSVFHLDGPDCIRHLDHLLSVPSLTAVQWTPGYPNPGSADKSWWEPIWKKVYEAGKSALVLGNSPDSIEPFLKEFGWEGTFITTGTDTEDDARALLDNAMNWK